MKSKKILNTLIRGFVLVAIIVPIAALPQKLNVVAIRLGQKIPPLEWVAGIDTINVMNNAILNKLIITNYGKNTYYKILKGLKPSSRAIRLLLFFQEGRIVGFKHCAPQSHSFHYELFADSAFAEKLVTKLKDNIIFMLPPYEIQSLTDSAGIYRVVGYELYYLKDDIDSLSKDEFLDRQIQRIDTTAISTATSQSSCSTLSYL